MTAGDKKLAGIGAPGSMVAGMGTSPEPTGRHLQSPDKLGQRVALRPAGTQCIPADPLAWALGLLGVGACIAPWLVGGWLWLKLIGAILVLLACYDGAALSLARKEFTPVQLLQEKGLGGREGQTIQVPLALAGSGRHRLRSEVRVAIMPATQESETAFEVLSRPQRLKLERPNPADGSTSAGSSPALLWSWTSEIALLRRGLWPGPRLGVEWLSRFGIWRLRQWLSCQSRCESRRICAPGGERFCAARFTVRWWHPGRRRGPDRGANSSACAIISPAIRTQRSRGRPRRGGMLRSRGFSNGNRSRKCIS